MLMTVLKWWMGTLDLLIVQLFHGDLLTNNRFVA